jgi:nucleoside-diphosphate kinase
MQPCRILQAAFWTGELVDAPQYRLQRPGNCAYTPRPFMETTLILLKPDCVTKGHCGEVINRFEKAGFKIRGCKMMKLDSAILREHYAHIASKPFFPDVENFMSSSPVVALALEGENVIEKVRALAGPTDSKKADKGTIRGDLGVDMMVNIVHASDSPDSAKAELARFFKPEELFSY